MRQASLKQSFLSGVSLAAVHVAETVSPAREVAPSFENGASRFLVRVRLWLRLIFGLGTPRCESVSLPRESYTANRRKRRTFAHRLRRRASTRKVPAHDLEMLMGFVPGARRGLTLNQHRERLARIAISGRAAIYHNFIRHRIRRYRIVRVRLKLRGSMGLGRGVSCAAPLWPD